MIKEKFTTRLEKVLETRTIICDWCKRETKWDWKNNEGVEIETTIQMEIKHQETPYGGYSTHVSLDLCPECFQSMLDLLESKGVKSQQVQVDW